MRVEAARVELTHTHRASLPSNLPIRRFLVKMPRLSRGCFLYTHTRRKCCPSQLVPSVGLEPTASCSQSRCTADCAMTTYHASSGLSGSEEADPSWRWSRWGTYPSPATGFQCWLLIRCFYPHSLSGETALVGRKVSRLSRYGRRCQHTACTSCGFAHPLARCGSSFWCRCKQLQ